jgi:small-conductance mechanosensitive channel
MSTFLDLLWFLNIDSLITPEQSSLLITATFTFLLSFLIVFFIKKVILKKLRHYLKKNEKSFGDFVVGAFRNNLNLLVIALISAGITSRIHFIDNPHIEQLNKITIIVFIYYGVKLTLSVFDYLVKDYTEKLIAENQKDKVPIIAVGKGVIDVVIIAIAGMLLLQNLGFNVTTLLAGVGIGGVAIAFALKNILEDIFSSVSIHFDKPFKVGDFIKLGDNSGTVSYIGIKTSRLKTPTGDELIISNKELTQSKIRNFSRLTRRRVEIKLAITYDTPLKKIKNVNSIVESLFTTFEKVDFDRIHLSELGDHSINFEVIYFVNSSNIKLHFDIRQSIILKILEEFDKAGIELAFPTQSIILEKKKG